MARTLRPTAGQRRGDYSESRRPRADDTSAADACDNLRVSPATPGRIVSTNNSSTRLTTHRYLRLAILCVSGCGPRSSQNAKRYFTLAPGRSSGLTISIETMPKASASVAPTGVFKSAIASTCLSGSHKVMVVPSVLVRRQRMSDIAMPCFDLGEWLQRNRGGGTIEVGAPASGIRRALPMP